MLGPRAPLDVVATRVVDEDAAHGLRRHRQEMGAILPLHALVIDQPQIGFVDQGGGSAGCGLTRSRRHVVVGQAVELLVHDRRERAEARPDPRHSTRGAAH